MSARSPKPRGSLSRGDVQEQQRVVGARHAHGQERAWPHVRLAARELDLLGQEGGDPRPDADEDLLRVLALRDEERVLRERRHHLPPDVLALDLVEREDIGLLAGEELHPRGVARIGVLHVLDVPGGD